MTKKIIRATGLNKSEEVLARLCDRAFLKLWVYPNPHRQKNKELCDILVVFDNHIFLFSVKDIKFATNKEINVAWQRWKKKAIDDSIKQLEGAESAIRKNPDSIFINAECTEKLPIKIELDNCVFHRIIVAHGAAEACKNFSDDNINGSLAIAYDDKISSKIDMPFNVSLQKEKIFHIFDSYNLEIILGEIDTTTDFIFYLEAKEKAIKKYNALAYCGEEDLLQNYYSNFDEYKKKHFIGAKEDNVDFFIIAEGHWSQFIMTDQYKRIKKANKVSYLWDDILQRTYQNAFDGTLKSTHNPFDQLGAPFEMAKEPRFMRRELSIAITNSIRNFPENKTGVMTRSAGLYPSFYHEKRYVFLQFIPMPNVDYETEYRPMRQKMLEVACAVAKNKNPDLKKVIGIAIDSPKYSKNGAEDFLVLDCSSWSDEQKADYDELNKTLKFFESKNIVETKKTVYEFLPKEN